MRGRTCYRTELHPATLRVLRLLSACELQWLLLEEHEAHRQHHPRLHPMLDIRLRYGK